MREMKRNVAYTSKLGGEKNSMGKDLLYHQIIQGTLKIRRKNMKSES